MEWLAENLREIHQAMATVLRRWAAFREEEEESDLDMVQVDEEDEDDAAEDPDGWVFRAKKGVEDAATIGVPDLLKEGSGCLPRRKVASDDEAATIGVPDLHKEGSGCLPRWKVASEVPISIWEEKVVVDVSNLREERWLRWRKKGSTAVRLAGDGCLPRRKVCFRGSNFDPGRESGCRRFRSMGGKVAAMEKERGCGRGKREDGEEREKTERNG